MKITVRHYDQEVHNGKRKLIDKFLRFLYNEYPVDSDVEIHFLPQRKGNMTTGSRDNNNVIKVLTKSRITRDIFRTLAHEWVHILQDNDPETIKKTEREIEDHANSLSGYLVRKFQKENPHHEVEIYKD